MGAAVYFLCVLKFQIPYVPALVPYAVGYSSMYALTMVTSVLALKKGAYGPTMLIHSYSVIPPALFGIFLLGETVSLYWYIGFVLTLFSMYFVNSDEKEKDKIKVSWLLWVALSFIGNAAAVIVLKLTQVHFDGAMNNLIMVYGMLPLAAVLILAGLLGSKHIGSEFWDACKYGLPRGAISGITNFFGLILIGMIPAAVLYPMGSAFGIAGTYLISVFIFKEKLTKKGVLACVLGIAATAFLNL